jgi:addiction module HigA family antidote
MRKEFFANEGGINGAGTGYVDTKSEDFQILLSKIRELRLSGIRFRMADYLKGESQLLKPNDIPSLLSECIEALEIKKKDFAAYIGIEDSNLSAMLKGSRRISPAFALKLEQIFDISATQWLSVQAKNELDELRKILSVDAPKLSSRELCSKVMEAKLKKHEPTRKTTGQ